MFTIPNDIIPKLWPSKCLYKLFQNLEKIFSLDFNKDGKGQN
jgi:hypothetical protein